MTITTINSFNDSTNLEKSLNKLVQKAINESNARAEKKRSVEHYYPPGTFEYAVACDMIDRGYDVVLDPISGMNTRSNNYWNEVFGSAHQSLGK